MHNTRLAARLMIGVVLTLNLCSLSLPTAYSQQPRPTPAEAKDNRPGQRPPKKKLRASPEFARYAGMDASNRLIMGAATRTGGIATASVASYERGVKAFREGDAKTAAAEFEKALTRAPRWAEAWYGLGAAHARLGEDEKAVSAFTRALDHAGSDEPLKLWAYYGLGNAHAELEEYESAVAAYKSAVSLGPDLSRPRFNLGLAYLGLGRKEDALAEFKEAVKLNPQYAEARYNLAVVALDLGDRPGAAAQQRELQTLNAELAARLAELIK